MDPAAGASVTHSWTWTGDGQVGSVDGAPVSWDHDGNRTGYKGGHTDYQADDAIRPSSTVAYDAVGNQTKNPCGTAVYDGLDRTTTSVNNGDTAAKCGTAQTETVGYDGLGRQSTLSSTTGRSDTYRYGDASQSVLADDTNSPATTARYLQGPTGQALAAVDGNGSRQTLGTDLQGSTVLTLGAALPAVCKARFDPWGDPEDPATPGGVCQTSGSTANGRWYRQQQRDPATGNYQNGARTYNPATATWLTPDNYKTDGNPTSDLSVGVDPLTQNRYGYVNGNPINLQDPDGHKAKACDGMSRDQCKKEFVNAYSSGPGAAPQYQGDPNKVQLMEPGPVSAPVTPEQQQQFKASFSEPTKHGGLLGFVQDTVNHAIHGFLQGGMNVASTVALVALPTPLCQLSVTCREVGGQQLAAIKRDPVRTAISLNPATAPVNNITHAVSVAKKQGVREGWMTLVDDGAQQIVPAVLAVAGAFAGGALSPMPEPLPVPAAEGGLGAAEAARDAAGLKPNGLPNRDSAAYVGITDGGEPAVGASKPGGAHAEDAANAQVPGGQMTKVMGWRRNLATGALEWTEIPICTTCQGKYSPSQFPPDVRADPGGPWGR